MMRLEKLSDEYNGESLGTMRAQHQCFFDIGGSARPGDDGHEARFILLFSCARGKHLVKRIDQLLDFGHDNMKRRQNRKPAPAGVSRQQDDTARACDEEICRGDAHLELLELGVCHVTLAPGVSEEMR